MATSDAPDDDAIDAYCQDHKIACMRGSLAHVAERFRQCANHVNAPAFVRICGASPLIDPDIVQQAIELYQQHEVDLVSNIVTRTFPKGQSVEVVRSERFNAVCDALCNAEDREHVTRYYYEFKDQFRIMALTCPESVGHIQLSVDTLDDLQRVEAIIAASSDTASTLALDGIYTICARQILSSYSRLP